MRIKAAVMVFAMSVFFVFIGRACAYTFSFGNPDASVTVVEYSDYQCPWCAQFEKHIFPYLYKHYIKPGYVDWKFRDFPLVNIHDMALRAAEYADCSGKYYLLARYELYRHQGDWLKVGIYKFLTPFIPNIDGVRQCVREGVSLSSVKKDMKLGYSLGIQGTPTFVFYKNGRYAGRIDGAKNATVFIERLNELLNN